MMNNDFDFSTHNQYHYIIEIIVLFSGVIVIIIMFIFNAKTSERTNTFIILQ